MEGLYLKLAEAHNKWTTLISIDVPRTFSSGLRMNDAMLASLGRILNAYANLNPEVGYCQGMNFLVGLILRVVEGPLDASKEEETFWVFACLMDYDGLRDFYREGFPLLMKYTIAFYDLMKIEVPDLYEHFEKEGISPSLFLHQWYLSLFINCLPFPTVLILWDGIICDGLPIVLSVSISLLKVLKNVLIKMDFEQIIKFFKTMRNGDEECDAKIIGQLLVKQSALVVIPTSILRSLSSATPPPSSPNSRTSPLVSPWVIVPLFSSDSIVQPSPNSPTLLQRVSSAFSWTAAAYSDADNL